MFPKLNYEKNPQLNINANKEKTIWLDIQYRLDRREWSHFVATVLTFPQFKNRIINTHAAYFSPVNAI